MMLRTTVGAVALALIVGATFGYCARGQAANDWANEVQQEQEDRDRRDEVRERPVVKIIHDQSVNRKLADSVQTLLRLIPETADPVKASEIAGQAAEVAAQQAAESDRLINEALAARDASEAEVKRLRKLLDEGEDVVVEPRRKLLGFIPAPDAYVGGGIDILTKSPYAYAGVSVPVAAQNRVSIYGEGFAGKGYTGVMAGVNIEF